MISNPMNQTHQKKKLKKMTHNQKLFSQEKPDKENKILKKYINKL
jgi:hypothetical protein